MFVTMESRMWVLFFLLFAVGIHQNKACLEVERLALLDFKEFLKWEGYDADYLLPSWEDDPKSDCCDWERVSCDGSTNRVIKLSLDNIRQLFHGIDNVYFHQNDWTPSWFINVSTFQHFDELLVLNLSRNSLRNWNHKKGSENVFRFKKLETLDLSWNHFEEDIIPSLKGLSSLKNLNLALNEISNFSLKDLLSFEHLEMLDLHYCSLVTFATGEEGFANSTKWSNLKHLDLSYNLITNDWFPSLGKLLSLEYLDLSFNGYRGPFPIREISGLSNLSVLLMHGTGVRRGINGTLSIQNQTALSKLQILDLDKNFLSGISIEFGALTSLRVLDLSYNELNDSAIPELCGLKMLEELDLSYNNFTVIPQCLHNLTSLKVLDISHNAIMGQVPSSWISALTSLTYINFKNNYLQGLFSFSTFNNHSQLETVILGSYDESFKVETEDENWMPKFQLKILALVQCKLNSVSHKIPSFLSHQRELRVIDLSNNNLQGRFPDWLLANNTRMIIFDLRNNSFIGDFNIPLYPMTDLLLIDISENQIKGMLPRNTGNIFPNLVVLQLSMNGFRGSLPSSVGLMRNLGMLDLSSNNFSGEVPETLFQCTNLEALKLSNNEFTGNFFSTRYNLSNLITLQLNDNKFMGSMSDVQMNAENLNVFDISFNFMSGEVPAWINRTVLAILNLRHNSLKGEVSCDVFAPSYYVDLSQNTLSGMIPSCSNMQYSREVHLESNNFIGSIPKALLNSSNMVVLNLRDNRLSGAIPNVIGNPSSLKILLLGANQLSGVIPRNICLQNEINLLDLSNNYLSGSIPLCLGNLSFDQCLYDNCGFEDSNSCLGCFFFDEYLEKNKVMDDVLGMRDYGRVYTQIDFITKNNVNTYKGDILNFMSGLDLSCNDLVGKIPPTLGNLSQLHALNLSYNHLTGSILTSFQNLVQIESLDLSHNRLSGEIPSQLTQLTFLEVFSVAYNNLSGRIPYGIAQFGTFERSSYEGNAYLCGKPLDRNCSGDDEPVPYPLPLLPNNGGDERWYDIDKVTFFASFLASFAVFFAGVIAFLHVNSYWGQYVFFYGEKLVFWCYYFVSDNVSMLIIRFLRG